MIIAEFEDVKVAAEFVTEVDVDSTPESDIEVEVVLRIVAIGTVDVFMGVAVDLVMKIITEFVA